MESALPALSLRTTRLHRRSPLAAWVSIWIAATTVMVHNAGCAPRAGGQPAAPNSKVAKKAPPVNTGLSALASNAEAVVLPPPDPSAPMTDSQKAAWAQQSALNLEQLLRDGAVDDFGRPKASPAPTQATQTLRDQPQRPQLAPPPPPPSDTPASTGLGALAAEAGIDTKTSEAAPAAASVAVQPATKAQPQADPLTDLAARMASLLRPAPGKAKAALGDAAALVPIEAMQPGVLATLDNADNPLAQSLEPVDLAVLRQARTRLLADAETAPDLLIALRGSAAQPVPPLSSAPAVPPPKKLTISRAVLCTRVAGFGRFDPYSSTTFVAGRTIRAIVYSELDGFTTRPAHSGDPLQTNVAMSEQVSVQLSQTLTLYNDKDGLLAWHRPAQAVTETSRSARRDFYLIQIIELPPTLSVGRYNLKVTVADSTTHAEAESIIPIDIVADPSLVYQPR